jgi:hypothetical protein
MVDIERVVEIRPLEGRGLLRKWWSFDFWRGESGGDIRPRERGGDSTSGVGMGAGPEHVGGSHCGDFIGRKIDAYASESVENDALAYASEFVENDALFCEIKRSSVLSVHATEAPVMF